MKPASRHSFAVVLLLAVSVQPLYAIAAGDTGIPLHFILQTPVPTGLRLLFFAVTSLLCWYIGFSGFKSGLPKAVSLPVHHKHWQGFFSCSLLISLYFWFGDCGSDTSQRNFLSNITSVQFALWCIALVIIGGVHFSPHAASGNNRQKRNR